MLAAFTACCVRHLDGDLRHRCSMHTDRWRLSPIFCGVDATRRVCSMAIASLMTAGVAQRCRTHNRHQTSQRRGQSDQQKGPFVSVAGGHQI